MKRFLLALLLGFFATSVLAWGEKGHAITTQAASLTLPNDLPRFFYDAMPQLEYLGDEPDRWRGGGESLEAENAPNHFLDFEYADGVAKTLPRDRYAFIALMEKSGRLRQHGLTPSTTGFLPWRIAELSEQLTTEWRIWRATRPGSPERAYAEHEIVETAGLLSHYVGDASNPLHATLHFNGWADANNPNGYSNDCDVHSRFETWFVNRAVETGDVVPKVTAAAPIGDPFTSAVTFIHDSNALLDKLYQLDRDGGFAPMKPVRADAKAFAVDRIAAGASLLRDLWWSAWRSSAQPRRRGSAPTVAE
jgi:hypothetical protein